MRVKRKLRRQFGTSRALPSEWWQVQWTYVLHRWLVCCITWYNYIIFCRTDCVTKLFHVFCQYTTFKIALIIYALYCSIEVFNGKAGNRYKYVPEVLGKTKMFYCPRSTTEGNRTRWSFPIPREKLLALPLNNCFIIYYFYRQIKKNLLFSIFKYCLILSAPKRHFCRLPVERQSDIFVVFDKHW